MTEHTDTRRLQIPTSNMTAADLVAFADDVREAVDGSTPVKVTHRAGIFTPPETILVEIPTAESCDLPEIIDRDDEHPDLDPDVPVVDPTRCKSTVEPVLTHGKTGQILTRRAQLDQLPAGSIVVPTWLGDRTDAGLNTCTRFSDKWLRAIDDPAGDGVFPLGSIDAAGRPDLNDDDETGKPVDGNPLGVLVVYDPRDQL
ncbi:hypothetical protein GTE6_73 [Gordonia phage GTE6]|uniref:Uncharacterized protein n=1 Tax=Gordonia phage GTE6 TaxID=1647474 RepID=A0A0K0MX40_9CAUD|nr:hypothetical protein AU100_gp73 [Gordonia phage GTE6]AKI28715.1 hypothetical protein GTE6_73 [Gordonia phage GTE6]